MPTNLIVLRTAEQFMADYQPVYQPFYPLLLGKSVSYDAVVGQLNFRRLDTVGDIRAKHVTPKDTVLHQVGAAEGTKNYKKYFLANQFIYSTLQDGQGVDDVTAQVLDEHQKQADELLMLGEGTAANNVINNGLYWSADPNYTLLNSVEVDSTDRLYDFFAKVMATKQRADQVPGRKVLVFYGGSLDAYVNGLFPNGAVPFRKALTDALGPNWSIVVLPTSVTPANAFGWMVVNLDQVKLHYTTFPKVLARGQNEEKMYIWINFLLGSMMVEVLTPDGVIRQPATLEA